MAMERLIAAERELIRWVNIDCALALETDHDVAEAWAPYIARMRVVHLRELATELVAGGEITSKHERELITKIGPTDSNAAQARLEHLNALLAFLCASKATEL